MSPSKTAQPLANKTAVVTGSSSGIGRAIALKLAAAGAACVVHARNSMGAAEDAAGRIRSAGGEATVVCADLADKGQQDEFIEAAWRWRGRIDVWVNNAGADVLTGPAAKLSFEEKLDRLWRVDVAATMALGRMAGARMKADGGGAIVNMGWDQAAHGMAGDSGELFATAKGAIMAFTKSLAKSLAPDVRVNCLAPGWIKTAWGQQASGYWQERAESESLAGRWGTPEDVARVARFLASPEAGFMTGQVVTINGGLR